MSIKTTISGHHVDLTEAIRNHVEKKIQSVVRHNSNDVLNINVTLGSEKSRYSADFKVSLRGNNIIAKATSHDLYESIDQATEKLDRLLLKNKQKPR